MSISGLSGASLGVGAVSALGAALGTPSTKTPTAAEKAQAAADASAAQQKAMLEDIRKKGLYAWAQQEKLDALKAKIRQQILTERHQTEDTVAGMAPEDRASAEKSIEEEIARRIKQAMQDNLEGQAKLAAAQGKPPKPMIIDISI